MGNSQWGEDWPWRGIEPDAGGGAPSGGSTIQWNPKTGRYEPTQQQPGTPGGGGLGVPGGSGGGGGPAAPTATTTAANPTAAVPWYKNPTLWNNVINGAMSLYGISRSGQTPNTYPVPLTQSEQNTENAKGSLFNYQSGFTDQYLRGMNNFQPDWQQPTNAVGNQAFMGGVKIPQIDWSKMPSRPTYGTAVNVSWDDIEKLGPEAARAGRVLASQGMSLQEIYKIVQEKFGTGVAPTP